MNTPRVLSTLISPEKRRARPKIANYPFTTLNPNLGVVFIDNKEIIIADIPGLIEGAHSGSGLGDKFLKHIERCKSIIHMIDINEDDLVEKYKIIRNELKEFNPDLIKKRELIVFNKIDLIDEKEKKEKIMNFTKKIKKKVYDISVERNINVKNLLRAI